MLQRTFFIDGDIVDISAEGVISIDDFALGRIVNYSSLMSELDGRLQLRIYTPSQCDVIVDSACDNMETMKSVLHTIRKNFRKQRKSNLFIYEKLSQYNFIK